MEMEIPFFLHLKENIFLILLNNPFYCDFDNDIDSVHIPTLKKRQNFGTYFFDFHHNISFYINLFFYQCNVLIVFNFTLNSIKEVICYKSIIIIICQNVETLIQELF